MATTDQYRCRTCGRFLDPDADDVYFSADDISMADMGPVEAFCNKGCADADVDKQLKAGRVWSIEV